MNLLPMPQDRGCDLVAANPGNLHLRQIGGEPAVRTLVERFYHHMDTLPEARTIRDAERDAWMACMTRALDEVVADGDLRAHLAQAFFQTATFLRNR